MNKFELKNRSLGTFIGLIVGDALGTTLEFQKRDSHPMHTEIKGGGVFNLPLGGWTDDTCMALAVADALITDKNYNAETVAQNFLNWYQNGAYSFNQKCFDIGRTTAQALRKYKANSTTPYHGLTDADSSGNGGIMRLAPIFTFFHANQELGQRAAIDQSLITHASLLCKEYAKKSSQIVYSAFRSERHSDFEKFQHLKRDEVKSTGYVVDTYEAACWAIAQTSSFEDALILAVNLAGDADTVGAVTGMFAGAIYGLSNIPIRWRDSLILSKELHNTAELLFETGTQF